MDSTDSGRIELDGNENIWLAFNTTSTDLFQRGVVTSNALQTALGSKTCSGPTCTDVVLVKLAADGSKILFGTYLGGSGVDNERSLRYRKN